MQSLKEKEEEIARLKADLEIAKLKAELERLKVSSGSPSSSSSSSDTLTQFKHQKTTKLDSKELSEFLNLVGQGKQEEAEAMLRRNPNLGFGVGVLTDCAGRKFKQITSFQYAVWALDWHMWEMIKNYLPTEIIKKQLEELKTANWVEEHGTQASWDKLIYALNHYSYELADYNPYDDHVVHGVYESQRQLWLSVGKQQLMLPAHVINEYNYPNRAFYPCPDFKEQTLPRVFYPSSSWISSWWKEIDYDWQPDKSSDTYSHRFNAAWYRGDKKECNKDNNPQNQAHLVGYDKIALQKLFDTRKQQLIQLLSQCGITQVIAKPVVALS